MQRIDAGVAQVLNAKHVKLAERINAQRVDPSAQKPGDLVWYRRLAGSGYKLDSRWLGPAAIIEREGERSYVVEVKLGYFIKAPRVMPKPMCKIP